MNKNILTLVSSIVFTLVWMFFIVPRIPVECDGFGCIGAAMEVVFINVVVIPIIFGFIGAAFSGEKRVKQFFISFGMSLLGVLIILLPSFLVATYKNKIRTTQEVEDMKARYYANPEQYKQRPF